MSRDHQLLDSYQNPIDGPDGNESVEAISIGRDSVEHISHQDGYMEVATIYAEEDPRWDNDEDAERIASDLSPVTEKADLELGPLPGPGSDESNSTEGEPSGKDESERGRAASGESFEDEADAALFRSNRP